MKNHHIILIAVALCCSCCTPEAIDATDSTLKAELEVITPVVGHGDQFEARLFCSATDIVITDFSCEYPLLVDGDVLNRYASYHCPDTGLRIGTAKLHPETDGEVTLTLTVRDQATGQTLSLSCTFAVLSERLVFPGSITPSARSLTIAPSTDGYSTASETVHLTFDPEDCLKDYVLTYSREDWQRVIEVTPQESALVISAPQRSSGGDVTVTVTSAYNSFVSTTIDIRVRKDVALVITGTSCGDKARVTWNRYESYLFTDLHCYIAEYEGDIESVMRSSSKDASGLSFSSSQSSFDYDIEFSVKRMSGSQVKTTRFPYRCLSNAKTDLGAVRRFVNSETDRKTRDHDTEYEYYTLVVSGLSYSSSIYNIRYIVHLYKARKDGHWVACDDFTDGYDLEKNKYWYAAADTDEWITERK